MTVLSETERSRIGAKVERSLAALDQWVEHHNYEAYDPGDGSNSFLHALTFNHLFLERLLQQAVYRAPFNLRPALGIRPHRSTKGMGYMAWGYTRRFAQTQAPEQQRKARWCLDWLMEHRSPGFNDFCWGNDFSFSTRAGKIPRQAPTIVWSGLIGQAFLTAAEAFQDESYLRVAESICRWITTLPREQTSTGVCLSYVAFKQSSIHNSNMLGGALLAKVGARLNKPEFLDLAREAMRYSCTRQLTDGAWYYGEEPKYHWIDNFHTGYNLDSLKRYLQATGETEFAPQLQRGWDYFKRTFIESNGRPKYYHNRALPTDIQCAAQAVDTLAFFAEDDPEALPLGIKVADWTIDNMQDPDGHFYYRDFGWAMNKTAMLHWGQATMFKAVTHLLSQLANHSRQARTAALGFVEMNPAPDHLAEVATMSEEGRGTPATPLTYVLITPARNESALIEQTIQAVISQSCLPARWVIVSDGSTDGTDEIVQRYCARHAWIELLRMPERTDRQFAAKAHAFNAGCSRLKGLSYHIIGNLDADITFEPDYFSFLLSKFQSFPTLGVAGTPFVEDLTRPHDHTYAHENANLNHVSGACQMFRRECFEQVGGYVPIRGGAIDWIAVTTARMKGWQTRTFKEKVCFHHRKIGTGTGTNNVLRTRFHYGLKAYYVGGHIAWETSRGLALMRKSPYILGGLMFLAGYFGAALRRLDRPVSKELMAFHRAEQCARLRNLLSLRSPLRLDRTDVSHQR